MVTLWLTRTWAIGYTVAFGLGFAVWLWHQPYFCLAIATLVYLLAHEGLRRGFQQFPWEPRKLPNLNLNTDLSKLGGQGEPCGWPYDRMLREIGDEQGIHRLDAVLCCMLGGWWLFVLTSLIPDPRNRLGALSMAFGLTTIVCTLARIGIYVQGYQSPLSLWGRIVTLRLIIPGYDQVFVAPICALLAGPIALGDARDPPATDRDLLFDRDGAGRADCARHPTATEAMAVDRTASHRALGSTRTVPHSLKLDSHERAPRARRN